MNHEEQRQWLIRNLLDEDIYYKNYRIPEDKQEQKDLLRSLMNVRMPKKISQEFLKIQDEYLTEENKKAGVADLADLSPTKSDDRIYLWQGDITALKVDAIVNAANSQMSGCFRPMHNCVDNIIHSKAGIELRLRCNDVGRILRTFKIKKNVEVTDNGKIII